MNKTITLLLLSFSCTLPCISATYLKIMYIADHYTICDNEKKCLQIRENPTGEWSSFDKPIQNFTYEEGFEYCLLVEVQTPGVSSPPIPFDSTQITYVLSEVKSKIKTSTSVATVMPSSMADSSKWQLYKLRMKDGTKTFSISKAYIQFDTKNNTVTGNADCNTFDAGFTIDSTSLKFDNIITTKATCKKHSYEPDFLQMLQVATQVKVTNKLLYIYKGKTLMALFTRTK